MHNRNDIEVYNGRLLPDDTPVDFVLWSPGRDFEIIEPGSLPKPPTVRSRGESSGGIAGWFLVPKPA